MRTKEEIENEIAHHDAQMNHGNSYAQGAVTHLKWVLEDSPKKIERLIVKNGLGPNYNEGHVYMWDKINEIIDVINEGKSNENEKI